MPNYTCYGRTTSIGYNKKFDDYNIFTLNWFKTEADRGIGYDGDGNYQNYDGGIARGWNAQYLSQLGEHWNLEILVGLIYMNILLEIKTMPWDIHQKM